MKATELLNNVLKEDCNLLTLLEVANPMVASLGLKAEKGVLYFTHPKDKSKVWKIPLDQRTRMTLDRRLALGTQYEGRELAAIMIDLYNRLMQHPEIEPAKEHTSYQPKTGPKPNNPGDRNVRDMTQQQIQQAGSKFQLESRKSSVNPKSLTSIKGMR